MNYSRLFTLLIAFLAYVCADGQAPSPQTRVINIDTAGVMRGEKVGESYVQYLSHDVELSQGGTKMYADSCVLDEARKTFKAYGNVSIIQTDGTALSADYIYYNGATRAATARGNVVLTDPPNTLWTDHLDYNLDSKVGVYKNGGVLQTEETTLWSDQGVYNGKTHWTHFTKDVVVEGPDYSVKSRELKYNTETKEVIFLKRSTIYQGESVMITDGGTYNSETQFADFQTRTTVYNAEQKIQANKLKYDKEQGIAFAAGNVRIDDTTQHVILFSDEAYYFENQKRSITYGSPLLIRYQIDKPDSFLLLADTLQTYELPSAYNIFVDRDSLGNEVTQVDTVFAQNFHAWYGVKFFTDSMQAVGDSMFYSEIDSAFRFYRDPIIWSEARQMKGDTIYAFMAGSSDLDSLKLMTNSSILSTPDGIEDGMDQILGTWIDSYFEKGKISKVRVTKNAQNLLYVQDDDDAYIGIYKSESNSVLADFTDGKIDSIKLYEDIDGEMLPMEGADFKNLKFERAVRYDEKRPMDKSIFYARAAERVPPKKQSTKKSSKKSRKKKRR